MRLRQLLLVPPLAFTLLSVTAGGCTVAKEPDNLCLFLKDTNSCYQTFLTDIGTQCTMDTFVGTFDTRDVLGKCTLTDANVPTNVVTQVDFDPPIELTKLPYTAGIAKLTINGTQCGTIEIGADSKLAISLDAYPPLADPSVPCTTSSTQFCGSSFTNTPIAPAAPGQSTTLFNTTCHDGTTFEFDRLQIEQQCVDQSGNIPTAKLVIMPNGVGKAGEVKLSIQYSPTQTLTYATCKILEQLPPCANGVKDGVETDTDCGGGVCTPCATDQACISGTDCTSGVCAVVAGIKKCQ